MVMKCCKLFFNSPPYCVSTMIPSIKGIIAETNEKAIKTFFILIKTKTMILIQGLNLLLPSLGHIHCLTDSKFLTQRLRSEERRVGKECRSQRARERRQEP